LKKDDDMTV